MAQHQKITDHRATLAGFAAIGMWSLLALLTDLSGKVPPFQLAAMTFFIGTLVGILWSSGRTAERNAPTVSLSTSLFGGMGLFTYHALYFGALKNAPAVEASMIAYLWPLLIVVGSALLPGEKLKIHHVIGAALGFLGTFFIISGGKFFPLNMGFALNQDYIFGHGLAFAAAFTWMAYSLLSRKFAQVPTKAVINYCAISTGLALVFHLTFETTIFPNQTTQWVAIVALGLLPVGAAFYFWDHGMKNGNIQIVGASSYAAPLLSTMIMIVFGRAAFTWPVAIAGFLITLGAALAAKDIIAKKV